MPTERERAKAHRLLWRAGFGGPVDEVEKLAALGFPKAVDRLLRPRGPALRGRPGAVDGHRLDPRNTYGHDVLWWLDRAVRARHPLVERMTFNWHDHFATSNDDVDSARLMMRQYFTLRRHALGRFRDLARAIVRDGAMQLFLSLANSSKDAPNENFARELLELFTLGVNNGYSERDIREAARALTGFTFDWDRQRFGWDPDEHDGGLKRILGRRGRFMPLDVVDIAVGHRNHAPFLCRKLWGYFSPRPCPPGLLRAMVRAYRASGTQVAPVLRLILNSRAFYRGLGEPDMVKPPFVYLAGMMRLTGSRVRSDDWVWMLNQMGQVPFYPPNVSGWEGGPAWLSTASVRSRFQAASYLLYKDIKDGSVPLTETVDAALASADTATERPWRSGRTGQALRRYAQRSVAGRTEDWEIKHFYPERQRVLRHLLLAGPDAQVS